MKKIITKGLAAILTAGMMISCSSDYLQLEPITSITPEKLASDANAAQVTFTGICESMYTQYGGWADVYFVMNGEPWISVFYGESYGCDDLTYVWGSLGVGPMILNWERMNVDDNWFCEAGWAYYYTLVSQCNFLLGEIDKLIENDANGNPVANESQGSRNCRYFKAGALTVRAHAFTRLLQLYGPRWEDSKGGTVTSIVLRTKAGYEDLPLATVNEVKAQVYKDLDLALELYDQSGLKHGGEIWEPDARVAHGVYARLAMVVNDWATAENHAKLARKDNPIMSAEQYVDGFCYANDEWMWANPHDNYVYYWAHGSVFACNGAYPLQWGDIGAGAINLELYRQVPKNDIRRTLYITPDHLVARTMREESFWTNANYCDEATCNINLSTMNPTSGQLLDYILNPGPDNPVSQRELNVPSSAPKAYQFGNRGRSGITIPMGAQIKFYGADDFGTNQFPYMRAAEMLLTEAEAACQQGKDGVAQNLLAELNKKRGQTNYNCSKTGDALMDEIRMYRRIELWGEGHCWYDFKRWNVTMERKVFEFGDPTSNNFPVDFELYADPTYRNNWRFAIPRSESQFNDLVKQDATSEMASRPAKK